MATGNDHTHAFKNGCKSKDWQAAKNITNTIYGPAAVEQMMMFRRWNTARQ